MDTYKRKRMFSLFISLMAVLCLSGPVFSDQPDFVKYERARQRFKSGLIFFNRMEYLASVEYFRQAVSMYPEYHTAREYLARAYRLSGYTQTAITEWNYLYDSTDDPAILHKINSMNFLSIDPKALTAGNSDYVLVNKTSPPELRHYRYSYPADTTVDNKNNYYITSFDKGSILKLNHRLEAVDSVNFPDDSKIYGIDYKQGILVAADFGNNKIFILNEQLDIITSFGTAGFEAGQFNGPQGVAFGPSGNIFVVDSGNNRIQKFNMDGNYISSFGNSGKYEGQFDNPTDIAVTNKNIYISDTGNSRVCVYDFFGNYETCLDRKMFSKPRGLFFRDDILLISDTIKGLVKYDLSNQEYSGITNSEKEKLKFNRLVSAVVDLYGNIVTVDHGNEVFSIYSPLEQKYNNLDLNVISVDVNSFPTVAVYVNVNDVYGRPVYNLDRNNFRVIEDSARLPNVYTGYFKELKKSLTYIVSVEKSERTKGKLSDYAWSIDFFLKQMNKEDKVRINGFNSDNWIENDFDWSRLRTLKAVKEQEFGSGCNISKVLYKSISDLLKYNTKRGIIIYTDGNVDNYSFTSYSPDKIIDYARLHFIPIYFISSTNPDPILIEIANKTGGKAFNISKTEFIKSIYAKEKNKLDPRYVLIYSTYKTPQYKGWWSDIEIKVDYQGKTGYEWAGYFVP